MVGMSASDPKRTSRRMPEWPPRASLSLTFAVLARGGVFTYGADPVKAGIVANLNRPEENVTGITWFGGDLAGKRLALLHDIIPNISTIGLLTGPSDPEESSQRADAQGVAGRLNLRLVIMNASTEREIDAAFATFAQQQVGAVIIGSNPFFTEPPY